MRAHGLQADREPDPDARRRAAVDDARLVRPDRPHGRVLRARRPDAGGARAARAGRPAARRRTARRADELRDGRRRCRRRGRARHRAQASGSRRRDRHRSALPRARPAAGDQPFRLLADRGVRVASSAARHASRPVRPARADADPEGRTRERRRLSRPARRACRDARRSRAHGLVALRRARRADGAGRAAAHRRTRNGRRRVHAHQRADPAQPERVQLPRCVRAVAAVPSARRGAGRPDARGGAASRRRAARDRPVGRGRAEHDPLTAPADRRRTERGAAGCRTRAVSFVPDRSR
ncbi:Disulfide bond formation protein DsbB subfamily, putative (fragment) [Burkholderia cenocepacia]